MVLGRQLPIYHAFLILTYKVLVFVIRFLQVNKLIENHLHYPLHREDVLLNVLILLVSSSWLPALFSFYLSHLYLLYSFLLRLYLSYHHPFILQHYHRLHLELHQLVAKDLNHLVEELVDPTYHHRLLLVNSPFLVLLIAFDLHFLLMERLLIQVLIHFQYFNHQNYIPIQADAAFEHLLSFE